MFTNKKILIPSIVVLVLVVAGWAFVLISSGDSGSSTPNAELQKSNSISEVNKYDSVFSVYKKESGKQYDFKSYINSKKPLDNEVEDFVNAVLMPPYKRFKKWNAIADFAKTRLRKINQVPDRSRCYLNFLRMQAIHYHLINKNNLSLDQITSDQKINFGLYQSELKEAYLKTAKYCVMKRSNFNLGRHVLLSNLLINNQRMDFERYRTLMEGVYQQTVQKFDTEIEEARERISRLEKEGKTEFIRDWGLREGLQNLKQRRKEYKSGIGKLLTSSANHS